MIFIVGLLLSVVVSTASSLSCITCSQNNATSCQGSSTICPNQTMCGSLLLSMTKDRKTQWIITRGCFQQKQCEQPMIFRIATAPGKNIISCCTADNCTPTEFQFPVDNLSNGMTCPACSSTQLNGCSVTETMNCAGNETQCASVTLSGPSIGSFSFQGCTNVNFCTYGNFTVNDTTSNIFCSNAINMTTNNGITPSNSTTTIGNNVNTTGSSDTNNTFGYTTNTPFTISSDIKDVSEDGGNGCGGLQGHFLLPATLVFVLMNQLS